jgi:predicted HTH transcriptional regulator
MYYWHALPDNWQELPYTDFLKRRREMMAGVIRDAYDKVSGEPRIDQVRTTGVTLETAISQGETTTTEFKAVLRLNNHTGERDARLEHSVLRTIAGFLNGSGGTLIIGVTDDGEPLGIQADKFPNEDKMYLHLVNLVRERMGPSAMMYIHPHFEDYEGARVMVVDCSPAKAPVHLKDCGVDKFYIRTGASTSELTPKQALDYVDQRFTL